jgi:hypothetical protein
MFFTFYCISKHESTRKSCPPGVPHLPPLFRSGQSVLITSLMKGLMPQAAVLVLCLVGIGNVHDRMKRQSCDCCEASSGDLVMYLGRRLITVRVAPSRKQASRTRTSTCPYGGFRWLGKYLRWLGKYLTRPYRRKVFSRLNS